MSIRQSLGRHYRSFASLLVRCDLFALRRRRVVVGVALTLGLLIWWRFAPLMSWVFYGDDLWYLLAYRDNQCGANFSSLLVESCANKFRPVPTAWVLLLLTAFDSNSLPYLLSNVLLLVFVGCLVYAIIRESTSLHWGVAAAVSAVAVLSRFASYSATQVIGPVETLPLLFSLGAVIMLLRVIRDGDSAGNSVVVALGLSLLAAFSHERYLVLSVWLGLALVSAYLFLGVRTRHVIVLVSSCFLIPVFYLLYKIVILEVPFLVGTGGTDISLDAGQITRFFVHAMLSIFGFNTGPDYLVGLPWSNFPAMLKYAVAPVVGVTWLSVVVAGIVSIWRYRHERLAQQTAVVSGLIAVLAIALIVPATLTIRLEQRWLFTSFILLVLIVPITLLSAIKGGQRRRVGSAAVLLICLSTFAIDSYVLSRFSSVYFVSSARFAQAVADDLIGRNLQTPATTIIAPRDHCNWTLAQGGFFRVYGRDAQSFECISSSKDLRWDNDRNAQNIGVVYLYEGVGFSEVTGRLVDLLRGEDEQARPRAVFSFLKNFERGKLDSLARVDSPSGTGAFILPLFDAFGSSDALVVVSGFTYWFRDVAVSARTEIRFSVGMVYPSEFPARLRLTIDGCGHETMTYLMDLAPPSPGRATPFRSLSLALPCGDFDTASIGFGAETPVGSNAGHWIAFLNPRVVAGVP